MTTADKVWLVVGLIVIGIVIGFWLDTCPIDDCKYGTEMRCLDGPSFSPITTPIEASAIIIETPSPAPSPKYTTQSCKEAQEVDYPDFFKGYEDPKKFNTNCYSHLDYYISLTAQDDHCHCYVLPITKYEPEQKGEKTFIPEKIEYADKYLKTIEFYLK